MISVSRGAQVLGLSVILAGCARSAKAPVVTSHAAASLSASTPTSASPSAPETTSRQASSPPASTKFVTSLSRAQVRAAIALGVGALLQHIALEDWPVMHEGRFHGFKLRAIDPKAGLDLRPGDVITRINGIVPEHPEDADTALRALDKATTLTIDFEREGKPSKLELAIVD